MGLLTQGPGQFFLFAAFVLLIFVSVSAPVAHWLYFLEANNAGTQIRLGNWGACVREAGAAGWTCTNRSLGYRADDIIELLGSTGEISGSIVRGLTYALVLHPIAAGIVLIAMIVSLTTNVCLDICGSLIAFFAFLVCLVALIVDSVLFVTARQRINSDLAGSPASLGNCYWMVVAATASLLLASITVCFGSARARRNKRARESAAYNGAPYANEPVMAERRHFWQRKPKY